MRKVIAAVDNSLAARAVLATASRLAPLFGAEVEAVHVGEDGDRHARAEAAAAGLGLRRLTGPTIEALAGVAQNHDVAVLVVGARRLPAGARPVGATAMGVITTLLKPVVVVPPDAPCEAEFRRVLIPLEGTASTSLAPKSVIELAHGAQIDVVVLHVHDPASLPSFTDQPQHQVEAWGQEFVTRYCPWGLGKVSLELRVGRRDEQILAVAEEIQADLIALGWSQELAAGRAPVVRTVLERGRVPVLLVPVKLAPSVALHEREEPWNSLQSSPV